MKKAKNFINSIWRYFGWKPLFGPVQISKHVNKDMKTKQEFIQAWCMSAYKTINSELERQIKKNGFDPDLIRSGQLVLTREESSTPDGNRSETYRIGEIEIMRTEWKVNGFSIHIRPREGQREVQKIATKLEQRIITATTEDIQLQAKAAAMVREFENTPTPDLTTGKIIKLPGH